MADVYSLPYKPLRVTSPYGKRDTDIPGATKLHLGVDLGADRSNSANRNVLAVADGVICNSYFNVYRGYVVIIDHGIGFKSLYQHLAYKGLEVGVKVLAGQRIGHMGVTGVGSGLHLHLEFIIDGKQVDPLPYLLDLKEVDNLSGKIFQTIEDVPKWYRPSVDQMIALGGITPSADKTINVSEDMCRIYTSFLKVGLLGALATIKGVE